MAAASPSLIENIALFGVVAAAMYALWSLAEGLRRRRRRKWMEETARKILAGEGRYGVEPLIVDLPLTDDGFVTPPPGRREEVRWEQVVEIDTYKEDMGSSDLICLLFTLADGRRVTIHEQTSGWMPLTEEMEKRFGIDPKWWWDIQRPTFAQKFTVLWRSADKMP
ncbi:MAG: hypothetical protein NTV86_21830 [Planctomycetota bacterium]|nr:hypothetical protein [Planctomycetota bacterium]